MEIDNAGRNMQVETINKAKYINRIIILPYLAQSYIIMFGSYSTIYINAYVLYAYYLRKSKYVVSAHGSHDIVRTTDYCI